MFCRRDFDFVDYSVDSEESQEDFSEDSEDKKIKKRDIFAENFRKITPGLTYIKFMHNGKNLRPIAYNRRIMYNILDVQNMRKKLYKLRDIDNADFDNLFGLHINEYNFSNQDSSDL